MNDFAEISDVEAIWRPATGAEFAKLASRIREASQLIRDETPLIDGLTVDERIANNSLTAGTVRDVVVAMVERMLGPERFVRQKSVAIDDGSISRTFDSTISGGVMFIDPAEMRRLMGIRATRQKAMTIMPGAGRSWTCRN